MNENNAVAIVVPMYQAEAYIERCIVSLTKQTYGNIRIVLVDDGSADNTLVIAKLLSQTDERVEVIEKAAGDARQGAAATRNRGLEYVSGLGVDWITFVDSDDYVAPDYVEYLLSLCESYHADIAYCPRLIESVGDNVDESDVNELKIDATSVVPSDEFVYLLLTDIVPSYCTGKMFPFSYWEHVRFPETFQKYEDSAILYQVASRAHRVVLGCEQKYVYVQREGSLLHTFSDMTCFTDAFRLIRDQRSVMATGHIQSSHPVPFQLLFLEQYRRYVNFCLRNNVEITITPEMGDVPRGLSGVAQLMVHRGLFNREAFLSNLIFLISRKAYCWQRRVRHK